MSISKRIKYNIQFTIFIVGCFFIILGGTVIIVMLGELLIQGKETLREMNIISTQLSQLELIDTNEKD